MSFIDELNSLDTSNPGGWPSSIKLASVVAVAILIVVGGYFMFIKDMKTSLEGLQK